MNSSKKVLLILFWMLVSSLYLMSSMSNDEFVERELPTIGYQIGQRGYLRRQNDICIVLMLTLATLVAVFYDSPDQVNLQLFAAIKPIFAKRTQITPETTFEIVAKLRLNERNYFKIRFRHREISQMMLILEVVAHFFSFLAIFLTSSNDFERFSWFRILAQLLALAFAFVFFHYLLPPLVHFYITSYYFLMRIKKLNYFISYLLACRKIQSVGLRKVLTMHNAICADIARYNHYWKVFYFLTLLLNIPVSLCSLQAILFGDLPLSLYLSYIMVFSETLFYVFFTGFVIARVSHRLHDTRKRIYRVLLQTRRMPAHLSGIRNWLELLRTHVESKSQSWLHLSHHLHCNLLPDGQGMFNNLFQIFITNKYSWVIFIIFYLLSSFFQIIVIYVRFFLLTHKSLFN